VSTLKEKLDAIAYSVEVAKRGLEEIKDSKIKRDICLADMHRECIRRGEVILKENNYLTHPPQKEQE
jgi:hypothetical protein